MNGKVGRFDPDFERLLNDIDKGKINVVLTKDLSRFGRDYIQAGYFIEKEDIRKNARLAARLFEDNALGKISDKRFASLSADYEKEQQELTAKLEMLQEKAQSVRETADKAQQFLGIRKYTELEQLDAKILNELIKKIIVQHKTVNEAGQRPENRDLL